MAFSGGLPGETLQVKFDDIKCMSLESTRAIQIVAKLQIEIAAPRVTLNTPQQLGTSRSPIQAAARVGLIVSKGTGGGNPPTGGGDTVMFMEYQFDALGEQGILCGTEFHDYPPFDDAPASFNLTGWLILGTGLAVEATKNQSTASDGRSSKLVFGSSTKSAQKLSRQMSSRGWTEDLIRDTVDSPFTTRDSINKATGNSATVFYTKQGSYVIVDNVTNEIVQISDNIDPSNWIPDNGIKNPYKP